MFPALFPMFLMVFSPAHAWPDESHWIPIEKGEEPMGDFSEDQPYQPSENATDLVGDDRMPLAYWSQYESDMYFRVRVNGDPAGRNGYWRFAFDLDDDPATYEFHVDVAAHASYSDGPSMFFVRENTIPLPGINDNANRIVLQAYPPDPSQARFTEVTDQQVGSFPDAFIEVRLDWYEEWCELVPDKHQSFRIAVAATNDTTGTEFLDLSVYDDGAGTGDLEMAWSSPLGLDMDGDGLDLFSELFTYGSDPDASDTDGDGLNDHDEQMYHLDPNVADTDGDQVSDGLEIWCDMGGQTYDRDGDGIMDVSEGTGDPDGDGLPSFCDLDGDGDGRLDSDESISDDDCDGTPNYRDANDQDGSCDTEPDDGHPTDASDSFDSGCSSVPGTSGFSFLPLLAPLLARCRRRPGSGIPRS